MIFPPPKKPEKICISCKRPIEDHDPMQYIWYMRTGSEEDHSYLGAFIMCQDCYESEWKHIEEE